MKTSTTDIQNCTQRSAGAWSVSTGGTPRLDNANVNGLAIPLHSQSGFHSPGHPRRRIQPRPRRGLAKQPIGATNSGPDANGVTVTIDTDASPHQLSVNIPASNAPEGKLFSCLKAPTRP